MKCFTSIAFFGTERTVRPVRVPEKESETLMSYEISPTLAPPASPPMFSSGFLRLLALQMAFGVSYSTFLLLPKFLKTELAANAQEIGWVSGTAVVASALFAPFVGHLAARFSRKHLLTVAVLLECVSAISFTWVEAIGPLLFALRAVQGLSFVIVFNCTATLAADHLGPLHLARGIGYLGVAMLCTNSLAPLVMEPLAAHSGWDFTFRLSALGALGSVLLVFALPKTGKAKTETGAVRAPSSESARGLLPIHYTSFLMGAGMGSLFTFVQPHALALGASRVGDFFLGYVVAAMSVRLFFGGLADKYGALRISASALALYAVVCSGAAFTTPELLFPLGAGLGISHGFLYPALASAGIARTSTKERSVFMGWFSGAFNTGYALSVFVLGPVADRFGFLPIFLLTGALLASGVAPLVNLMNRQTAQT